MRKLFPILFLPLFIFIACEDEEELSACDQYFLDADAIGWTEMFDEFLTASEAGDASYEYPSNWTSKCNEFYDLSVANASCLDGTTAAELEEVQDQLCTMNEN